MNRVDRRTRDAMEGIVEDWVGNGCPGNGELIDSVLDHLRQVAKNDAKLIGNKVHLFIENVMDGNA